MKRCQCCKNSKDLTAFSKDKSQEDGHSRRCKACVKENSAQNVEHFKAMQKKSYLKYQLANQEKSRQRYANNKEAHDKLTKAWYQKNKESKAKQGKEWRKNNLDRARQLCKNHYHDNKLAYRAKVAKRRAIEEQALPPWANMQTILEIYKNCPKGMQVDHIVPLNSDFVCGLHVEHNLQYLTPTENYKKSNSVKHLQWKFENVG